MGKIVLENICKSYGTKEIINNLNLSIKEGSFTVFVGPSGCGKSTILRMIAGIEEITSGSLYIDGKDMHGVKPGKRNIAMVFQNYALYPTMTVKENIEFGLKNRGIPKKERQITVKEIVDSVGLTEHLNKKPQFLSGGERQRVALARAMVKNPTVFLMDEPLSNLDAKLRNQMRSELIELHRKLEATFIYVTHDQVEAMSMGTDVVLLEKGEIQKYDTPHNLYHDPGNVFTAQFIGSPPMNILSIDDLQGSERMGLSTKFIGFRPEKAIIKKVIQEIKDDILIIKGDLMTREMLGAEVLYKVKSKGNNINIKSYKELDLSFGYVNVCINYEDLYFFDGEGERIYNNGITTTRIMHNIEQVDKELYEVIS